MWIAVTYQITAVAVRDIGLRDAADLDIFAAAKAQGVIIMTKNRDFVALVDRYGTPPHIIWLTCGNTSHARLREILRTTLHDALTLVQSEEQLVEISVE